MKKNVFDTEGDVYYIYPCGHKLGLTEENKPVAVALHKELADKFVKIMWPTTGEIHTSIQEKSAGKLVRDNIPQIISESGETCNIEALSASDTLIALKNKLVEEVDEFLTDPTVGELADIMEVVEALSAYHGGPKLLAEVKDSKKSTNGGFTKGYFLKNEE